MMIFIILFVVWIFFNQSITIEVCVFGLLISGAITWFSYKFVGYGQTEKSSLSLRRIPLFIGYTFTLLWEILKANIKIIKLTLSANPKYEPCLLYFEPGLTEEFTRVILANSITLSPGTITVSVENDRFCVHCLDRSMGDDIENSIFVNKLKRIEGV